jgi:hypothetical protein
MASAHHGTPITSKDNVVLETLGARDYCVSFYYPSQVEWVDANSRTWFGDNGIFSAFMAARRTNNPVATFDVAYWLAYTAWCRRWCLEGSGRCKWVVIPDPIGTGTQELDALIRDWPEELRPYGVPVWHTDEPIERAIRLLDQHGRLCVGAVGEEMVIGSPAFCARIDALWEAIAAHFGSAAPWVHMFRSMQLLEPQWEWPFASHDSTDLARNLWRVKKYGEHRLWAVKQRADRWDRLAAIRPTTWSPSARRQAQLFA